MAYSLSGERPLASAWPTALYNTLVRFTARVVKARRQRLALAVLSDMDDHRLWDLGISRADLNRMVRSENFDFDAIRAGGRGIDVWPPR